ncbi:tRNA-processing RNAse BN [Limimonas halophila]|uniref:UPF0761 membrane protein SAMN05216241_101209 n=1 Tax=Limimonas halophila TaxID=1082479 RepID=A0A1G7LES1_9PROT|nr:YihY family inner membrane protein [Limimonas halophila]SDF47530.1 tRNA-processing RNAse BN [Limimonas halophila]
MTGHQAPAKRAWSGGPRELWRRLHVRRRATVVALRVSSFATYTALRFHRDDGFRLASGLTYASLLALVPLLAIALAMVSAFPAFEGVRETALDTLFRETLPGTGDRIAEWMADFIDRAGKMTGPGVLGLAVTAILLLSNINGAFNAIWRVSEARPWAMRLLVYWALLTLGPLLLGASLSLSSAAFGALGGGEAFGGSAALARALSTLLLAVGLGVIYFVVPNRGVHPLHAAVGGLVGSGLFELATFGFGVYLANFPSYEAIYGAFSTLPIFLVWLFLSWCAVLLGAEVAAALPEWRAARARGRTRVSAGARLALGLALLSRLRAGMTDGHHLRRRELVRGLPATPAEVDGVLKPLRQAGCVARTQTGRWVLGRDLATVTLADLMAALDVTLEPGGGWPTEVSVAMAELTGASAPQTARSLEDMLTERAQTAPA